MSQQPSSNGGAQQMPCRNGPWNCDSVVSAPAYHPLRQALGSNNGDIRLPSILLSLTALLALVARALRRRSAPREEKDPASG